MTDEKKYEITVADIRAYILVLQWPMCYLKIYRLKEK